MLVYEKDLVAKGVDCFKLFEIFCNMSKAINEYYIYELFAGDNKIVLYSIDTSYVDVENCPCGLIYKVEKKEDELNIYIMFIATKYKYRKTGYASLFINEFIDSIKAKYLGKFENIYVILDSIETAVTYYEHFGFKWTTTEKKYDSIFHIDETNVNEHFIMVYKI
jgi:ribosomal protein S18 acetylase RimI-like enzyme